MHTRLIAVLQNNMGKPITRDLAAFICMIADEIPMLIPREKINEIRSETQGEFVFAIERMEVIIDEMKPMHQAHWDETESHRHNLELKADYKYFIASEKAGRYVLFTMRRDGKLVGNCAMYINVSKHSQTLESNEDTLYLYPEARQGRIAFKFVKYVENSLQSLGVNQINISVKLVNKASRFFRIQGYKEVEIGLTKMLEVA